MYSTELERKDFCVQMLTYKAAVCPRGPSYRFTSDYIAPCPLHNPPSLLFRVYFLKILNYSCTFGKRKISTEYLYTLTHSVMLLEHKDILQPWLILEIVFGGKIDSLSFILAQYTKHHYQRVIECLTAIILAHFTNILEVAADDDDDDCDMVMTGLWPIHSLCTQAVSREHPVILIHMYVCSDPSMLCMIAQNVYPESCQAYSEIC